MTGPANSDKNRRESGHARKFPSSLGEKKKKVQEAEPVLSPKMEKMQKSKTPDKPAVKEAKTVMIPSLQRDEFVHPGASKKSVPDFSKTAVIDELSMEPIVDIPDSAPQETKPSEKESAHTIAVSAFELRRARRREKFKQQGSPAIGWIVATGILFLIFIFMLMTLLK